MFLIVFLKEEETSGCKLQIMWAFSSFLKYSSFHNVTTIFGVL